MKLIKRIALLALVTVMGAGVANAEFRFGIKAGMNINKIHFNKDVANWALDEGNSCGWNAGVAAEFTVPIIGIGADVALLYSRMNNNAQEIPVVTTAATTEKRNVFGKNFIELPINIKYKFNIPVINNIIRPMVFTGPSFAFKLDKNITESMKTQTCQVAWNIGIGVELIRHLQVTGSYGFGINNIADNWIANTTDIKAKNNYWTIGVGYFF